MGETDHDDFGDFEEYGLSACPHCQGGGYVNCYCGGDMCLCDNHGEAACPVCGGEGEVSEERYERYMENLRKYNELMRSIWDKAKSAP